MAESLPRHEVEDFVIRALPGGHGFAMDLANAKQESVRLEFPSWMLHQLMRVLPKLDAAMQQPSADAVLLAYQIAAWRIEHQGYGGGLVMRLRDSRDIESALHFALSDAQDFHRELGEAISKVQQTTRQGGMRRATPQAEATHEDTSMAKLN